MLSASLNKTFLSLSLPVHGIHRVKYPLLLVWKHESQMSEATNELFSLQYEQVPNSGCVFCFQDSKYSQDIDSCSGDSISGRLGKKVMRFFRPSNCQEGKEMY